MKKSVIEATMVAKEWIQNRRQFTVEEMTNLREDYTAKVLKTLEVEEVFAIVKAEWQGKLKVLKAESRTILCDIKARYEDEERECALVPDFEAGTMQFYDAESGELVFSRRLRPNERQDRPKLQTTEVE